MLLTEILSLVNISANNQLSPEQVALFIDGIQKSVFQKNEAAFLQYSQVLTPYTTFTLQSSGYTDCVDSDIGKPVVDTDTGTGTLIAFDNSKFQWTIHIATTFTAGASVEVTGGTGAGQFPTTLITQGYIGPYAAPTNPPCRKIWGITQRKPQQFWIDWIGYAGIYWVNGLFNTGDYQALWGPIAPFETGQTYDLDNTFQFSFPPSLNPTNNGQKPVYYWVYWRNPPNITDLSDSSQLMIPEAYHMQLVLAINDYAGAILNREPLEFDQMIEKYLGGWLDALRAPFRDQRLNQNMTQTGGNGYGYGLGWGGFLGGGGVGLI